MWSDVHFNWKLVLMRILVNGASIAFTAWLLPGIEVTEPKFINFLILGAVFGLLNAFVKPIVQFLTLSLLFVTYGLVIIFINMVILILVAFLLGDVLVIENIWWAVAGGAVMGLIAFFLENLLGMSTPIIDDSTAGAKLKGPHTKELDRTEHLVLHVENLMDEERIDETQK
jgi:putative membrane protein